jgi:putative DNA primase/helicase
VSEEGREAIRRLVERTPDISGPNVGRRLSATSPLGGADGHCRVKDPIKEAIDNARVLSTGDETAANAGGGYADGHEPRISDEQDAPEFSEEAIALRFAHQHRANLRYVAKWNRWFRFTGKVWEVDDTLLTFDLARRVCREVAAEAEKPNTQIAIASSKTVAAVQKLAQADRRLAESVDPWDADPWALNTPRGVVDLKTGAMRQHSPGDLMTKITSVPPEGDCPRFVEFLHRVMDGDETRVAYLQRVLGYGLTGSTREHALFFLHGKGSNGKSVLLSTIAGILGSYHETAPISTFLASSTDQHPTDLAGLRGARLVTVSETEEGRSWAEARVKLLTGGDRISARFMRQDFFEYQPAFKLMFAGNHKPSLRSVDEAIRRRFHLLPFSVTIPAEERDPNLSDKLKAEWPGILAWMVEGALNWEVDGLQPPSAVLDATEDYLAAEDTFAAWLDEKCEKDARASSTLAALFSSWSAWVSHRGEPAGSAKRFSERLAGLSFYKDRNKKGVFFSGLRLVPDALPLEEAYG